MTALAEAVPVIPPAVCPPTVWQVQHLQEQSYQQTLTLQKNLASAIADGRQSNILLLTEHAPIYTLGPRTRPEHARVVDPAYETVPQLVTDRGGEITYHGPGQLIAYVIRDLRPAIHAVRAHVDALESVIINVLAELTIQAARDKRYPGVWVAGSKVAALGVRVRRGVAYHGIALNNRPDLGAFNAIVPCGIEGGAVTSLQKLGVDITMDALADLFIQHFQPVFNVKWESAS
ncbi:MAG: lipoyl(octanoyl) transferase LipB [Magnetococcales bacterium]|nr:lipoyl(octanoyl) transferase LipB [Magnetococcales bacterium]